MTLVEAFRVIAVLALLGAGISLTYTVVEMWRTCRLTRETQAIMAETKKIMARVDELQARHAGGAR